MRTTNPLEGLPPLIRVSQAAKILGISRSAAYRFVDNGELPTRKLGGRIYVVTALLHELITESDQSEREAA